MKRLLSLVFFFIILSVAGQNYQRLKLKKYKVATLSDSLKETSGLAFWHDNLLTVNDGGNAPEVFIIDKKTGKILNKIKTNLTNTDWEAITTDSANIYIGDFGNNFGDRKDLKIYKIHENNGNTLNPEKLQTLFFSYPDHNDFTRNGMNTDFDAESMFVKNRIPHIFTKEWKSKKVAHYELKNALQKMEETNIGFLVTDVSYYNSKLYAVGYTKKGEVFLAVFHEDAVGKFFTKPYKKFYLGSALSVGQVEGIAVDLDGIYISAEAFHSPLGTVKQSFYFIPRIIFDKILN